MDSATAQSDLETASLRLASDREHLVCMLDPVNANVFNNHPSARPRYFDLVQVDAADPWLLDPATGQVVSQGGARSVPKEGALLLVARTGRFLSEYGTLVLVLRPRRSVPLGAGNGTRSEFRILSFGLGEPAKVVTSYGVAHNTAVTFVRGDGFRQHSRLFAVGGQHRQARKNSDRAVMQLEKTQGWHPSHRRGIYAFHSDSLADVISRRWFPFNKTDEIRSLPIVQGSHPGCVERRASYQHTGCEFDGKLSLAKFKGRFLLYTRANLKPLGGGRFVQVAASAENHPESRYGPFSLLQIAGYDPSGPGNIYLAAVMPSPFDMTSSGEEMLLGVFAVNLGNSSAPISEGNSDGRSFLGLALSCNGRDWSRLYEVAPTIGKLGRTTDQPVGGGLLRLPAARPVARGITGDSGGHGEPSFSVLIHRDVYEIARSARTRSRLVRRELNRDAMLRLAASLKRHQLAGCTRGQL